MAAGAALLPHGDTATARAPRREKMPRYKHKFRTLSRGQFGRATRGAPLPPETLGTLARAATARHGRPRAGYPRLSRREARRAGKGRACACPMLGADPATRRPAPAK